jgi:hypothetical protein
LITWLLVVVAEAVQVMAVEVVLAGLGLQIHLLLQQVRRTQ